MSVTISIRVDDEVKKEIEALGYTPSAYIKRILMQELKKERSRRAVAWLKTHKLPAGENAAEEEIRKDRDSR